MNSEMIAGRKSGNAVLSILFVVLAIAVALQGVMLYRLYQKDKFWHDTAEPSVQASSMSAGGDSQHTLPSRPPVPRGRPDTVIGEDPFDVFSLWNRDFSEWNPFQEIERVREQMDRLFQSSLNRFHQILGSQRQKSLAFSPEMDLEDDGTNYVVRFDLPGVNKSQVSVKLDDRLLTVEARSADVSEEKLRGRVIRMERKIGQFARSIMLPGPVRAEGMKAQYEDGVLTVTIPKVEAVREEKVITL